MFSFIGSSLGLLLRLHLFFLSDLIAWWKEMVLKEQLAKQTGISVIVTALSALFGVASFFILTKLLPREDVAIMGISAGFLAIITPLMISPDIALYRSYAELKKNFNQTISAFFLFWGARTLVVMVVITVASFLLFWQRNDFLFIYCIGAGLVMNIMMLQASIQEIFYVEMRQREILNLNLHYYVLFLAFLGFILWHPALWVYLVIWISLTLLFASLWVLKLMRAFSFSFSLDIRKSFSIIQLILSKVAIWTHLMSSVVSVVYRADIFFLGFFALAFTTGNYTIAIMFSALFVLLPQILQKMCLTGLTRSINRSQDLKLVNAFVKYNFLISAFQFGFYLLFGEFLLSLIDAQNAASIFEMGLYIIAGISLYNVARPIHIYCVARADLKKFFVMVFIPVLVIAVGAYGSAAYFSGAIATAQANILVYGILSLLTIYFAIIHVGYKPSFEWVSSEEHELIKKVRARIQKGLSFARY